MNARFRFAATACFLSTAGGLFLAQARWSAAETKPARVVHAEGFDDFVEEPGLLPDGDGPRRLTEPDDESLSIPPASAPKSASGTKPKSSSGSKSAAKSQTAEKASKARKTTPSAKSVTESKPAKKSTGASGSSKTSSSDKADTAHHTAGGEPASVEQTGLFSRRKSQNDSSEPQSGAGQQPAGQQRFASQPRYSDPSQYAGGQAGTYSGQQPKSDIQRELEKLYQRDGRPMPELDVQAMQVQPGAAPHIPGSRHGPSSTSTAANSDSRPVLKPAKPNFLERMFGVGKARQKQPPASPPQPSPQGRSQASTNPGYATPARPAAKPPQPQPQIQSGPQPLPPMPTYESTPSVAIQHAPPVPPAPPGQIVAPQHEPAQIGPAISPQTQPAARIRGIQPDEPVHPPVIRSRDSQSFFDESSLGGDNESLDLSDDESKSRPANPTPEVLPNRSANGAAESPYSGLKLSPNEAEQKVASAGDGPSLPAPPAKAPAATDATSTLAAPPDPPPAAPPAAPPADSADSKIPTPGNSPATKGKEKLPFLSDDDDDEEDEDDDELELPPGNGSSRGQKLPVAGQEKKAGEKSADQPADKLPAETVTTPQPAPIGKTADESAAKSEENAPAGLKDKPAPATPEKSETPAGTDAERAAAATKLAATPTGKGFKGFCPVLLKDKRQLVEARAEFKSEYRGKTYTFSSSEAKQVFDANPPKYAPAGDGNDVVRQVAGEAGVEGSLEHAAWFRGRLYLFATPESRREFINAPSRYIVTE